MLEHLGGAAEATHAATAAEWGERRAADLNTIALECHAAAGDARLCPGSPACPTMRSSMTGSSPSAKPAPRRWPRWRRCPAKPLWDVGAGCGSIAIEWLRADDAACRHRDRARRGAGGDDRAQRRCARRAGAAASSTARPPRRSPASPPPDAIFVGGGLADPALLPALWQALRPGGRLVANVISTEGERALLDWQARHGGA